MVFVYIFCTIGIIATLLLMLPTLMEIYTYFYSIFANIKVAQENKREVRKELLNLKKEKKLEKIEAKHRNKEKEVENKEAIKEEEHEEVETNKEVEDHEEVEATVEVDTTPIAPVLNEEIANN